MVLTMPRISQSSIEQVRHHINIYDVVSTSISLKRSGSQFRGLSPFSQEKTPSFFINPEKNVFYCYSSNQGGDAIRFVQLTERLSFIEAIEVLAGRFNISLEYEAGAGGRVQRSRRKELLDLHDWIRGYYHQQFKLSHHEAERIRKYWSETRQLPLALADEFKIGFAPIHGEDLLTQLRKQSFTLEALRDSGLFYTGKGTKGLDFRRLKPRFRGRLMFPICNAQGQVVAFSGRQLKGITPSDDPAFEAKYINSPETELFRKGSLVFGLDVARHHLDKGKEGEQRFILVEGQLDALRCWQHGFRTAVAPQGTAITAEQLHLLKRYTEQIDCVLDGDAAGKKAALRLLPMALKAGHDVRFIALPAGDDPDSLLARSGREGLDALRDTASSAMHFAAQALLPENPSPMDKHRAREEIFNIIAECDQEDLRHYYLNEAGLCLKLLDEDDRAIFHDFRQFLFRKQRSKKPLKIKEAKIEEGISANNPLTTAEYELLLCIYHFSSLPEPVAEALDSQWIEQDTPYGILLLRTIAQIEEGLWDGQNLEELWENAQEQNTLYRLLAQKPNFENPINVANECIRILLEKFVKRRMRDLDNAIQSLPLPSDEYPRLQRQRIELRQLKQSPPQLQATLKSVV